MVKVLNMGKYAESTKKLPIPPVKNTKSKIIKNKENGKKNAWRD